MLRCNILLQLAILLYWSIVSWSKLIKHDFSTGCLAGTPSIMWLLHCFPVGWSPQRLRVAARNSPDTATAAATYLLLFEQYIVARRQYSLYGMRSCATKEASISLNCHDDDDGRNQFFLFDTWKEALCSREKDDDSLAASTPLSRRRWESSTRAGLSHWRRLLTIECCLQSKVIITRWAERSLTLCHWLKKKVVATATTTTAHKFFILRAYKPAAGPGNL